MAQQAEQSRRLGFVHLAEAVGHVAESLATRGGTLRWDPAPAVARFQRLCMMARVAAD